MNKIVITLISLLLMTSSCTQQKKIQYPETKRENQLDIYFGQEVADPYRWLEDDNSAETAEWVDAQNHITQDYLAAIPFRDELKQRFETIWNYPRLGVPFKKGGHYFFFKNDGLQNQSVLYMQESLEDEPQLLLDPNLFSSDGTIALGTVSPSPNGKYLAYSISRGGSDWNEIVVMDIATAQMLEDTVRWVKFSGITWYENGFYYSAYDAPAEGQALSGSNEFHKVYYHRLGTTQQEDTIIFQDQKNPKRNFYASVTDDEVYLIISESQSTSGNALYARLANKPKTAFTQIAQGFDYDYYVIDHIDGKLLVQTTNGAPKKQLVLIDPLHPQKEHWKVVIPESENVLGSVSLIGNYIYAEYLEDANSKGYFFDYEGNMKHQLELPTLGTIIGFNGDKGESIAFFGFTSFTFPSTIYQYDLKTHTSKLYSASEVDFDPDTFATEQLFFESKDGTRIPMFITYKKGMVKNGKNPVLLYGYGGFNISLTPSFSVSRLPFLEQGGLYVSVNLRGGGEYGKEWHQAGQQFNKQNVFDDFIAAAEYLIDNEYTQAEKIAIMGGSNGGLLVGACMTQRPELFKVAIPIVGVLDMLRYQNFTIGWAWATDYGRSDDNEEMFRYLLTYSPLHNIREGVEYPATLAITADHDDRVVPAHTFKFMAELQAKHQGGNPVLVRIETQAGHGAGKPTSKLIEENTDMYSFIMYNLGMHPEFKK
ncbi:MAG: prolyl oligopeptidase family serine peptidase [Bacteroidales bacterium]|nr:prolyl oligopeptidase family serine peptidase [Bacteroidales bacterium]MDD3701816.1 prolyl oligopeptidase family serine peptidase [Bacteroidales bacterium]MDY0369738.1 prolyl oligopeptidase family serine peptidase [Bacteroidales bacterium]